MHKINYSWCLDLHIRWFIMCTQTILAIPKVAWVNLLPLTGVNASRPCFHYLALWYFVLLLGATFSFLTHLYLLAFAFAVLLIAQQMPAQEAHVPCYREKQTKGELLCLSPVFLAGAEGQQRLHGDLICKSLWVESFMFPSATFLFQRLYLFIFREQGNEGEREGQQHWSVASHTTLLGTCPTTQACGLTGKWTSDLLVCRTMPNPLSHTSRAICHFP